MYLRSLVRRHISGSPRPAKEDIRSGPTDLRPSVAAEVWPPQEGATLQASPSSAQPSGAPETLLAAFENSSRSTFLRKKSAMMMAIARKPSRIAYSVVVWPSSRSRSRCAAICTATIGRNRTSNIWRPSSAVEGDVGGRSHWLFVAQRHRKGYFGQRDHRLVRDQTLRPVATADPAAIIRAMGSAADASAPWSETRSRSRPGLLT